MADREAAVLAAVDDPESAYYKGLCRLLDSATASARCVRASSSYTTIPFVVDDVDLAALEQQFGVVLKSKGVGCRSGLTPRVAALMFVIEASMLEHAGSGGRSVMLVDGDLVSLTAMGHERRVVERTNSSSRLAYGYFTEDSMIVQIATAQHGVHRMVAGILMAEIDSGGGEHFSQCIRLDGPKVDSVVFNHFKTSMNLRQNAYLVECRGGVGYGVMPFQIEMLTQIEGSLACFPGKFYVDKEGDTITLVPEGNASMSITHPYSQLMEFVNTNSLVVNGHEYLCEKYMSVRGILYYSLCRLNGNYEAPESLRAHYYDTTAAACSRVTFPEVKLSSEGVPVGVKRGEVVMLTSRLNKVLSRMAISRSPLVTPSEVFSALMDYNNMTVNSLDTACVADRMSEVDELRICGPLAMRINWRRREASGTLKTLLGAARLRHSVKDKNVAKFAALALLAWWNKPDISKIESEEIPCAKVVDWCGNDFSVMIEEVDPWVQIEQEMPSVDVGGRSLPGMPDVPLAPRPRSCVSTDKFKKKKFEGYASRKVVRPMKFDLGASSVLPAQVVVGETVSWKAGMESTGEMTVLKRKLRDKMIAEQGAAREIRPTEEVRLADIPFGVVPVVPVVDVDPASAIRSDLDDMVGGLPEMDAAKIGYRLAEVDIDKCTRGNISINDAKRNIPKGRYIRRPKVDAGVEGARVQCAATLTAAVLKRNVGIPANRGAVDLDIAPSLVVDLFIKVCFKPEWQSIVNRHIECGMWEPNEGDIDGFLQNTDETKVKKMLDEFFLEGPARLDEWKLMAKGKIKSTREPDAEQKLGHSQTIMFLEQSSTNAMYSAITRRVNDCVRECLRPNIRLNPQCSAKESEDWYNQWEPARQSCGKTYSYSVDSKDYDRSQEHPALKFEMEFHRRMGLDGDRYKKWESEMGMKRASNAAFGIAFSMVLSGISGDWKTLYRNGLIQMAAVVASTNLVDTEIVVFEVKGDDVDLETVRPIAVETAVARMSLTFNLASKFNTNSVRMFCKEFRIKLNGRWIQVADPWARVQSLCTPLVVGGRELDLAERWESLRDGLRHYDNELVLQEVATACQQFYGLKIRPLGICRALARFHASKADYMCFFLPPEYVD